VALIVGPPDCLNYLEAIKAKDYSRLKTSAKPMADPPFSRTGDCMRPAAASSCRQTCLSVILYLASYHRKMAAQSQSKKTIDWCIYPNIVG